MIPEQMRQQWRENANAVHDGTAIGTRSVLAARVLVLLDEYERLEAEPKAQDQDADFKKFADQLNVMRRTIEALHLALDESYIALYGEDYVKGGGRPPQIAVDPMPF